MKRRIILAILVVAGAASTACVAIEDVAPATNSDICRAYRDAATNQSGTAATRSTAIAEMHRNNCADIPAQ